MSSASNDLPSSVTSFKPQILKIKVGPFRSWIEKRLTEMLEGIEDEILWGLVFNYLEEAQKRAKREGPAVNPSGGLNAKEIQTALSGFLGPKQSRDFTAELFTLLAKAEASDTGIPPEFNMRPEEAENEALGIIQSKRKEMELADRVKREIRRTDYHNRGRENHRDHRERESREHRDHRERDHYDRERDGGYNRDRENSYRGHDYDRRERNYDHREHSDHRHRDYSRSPEKLSRERHRDRYSDDRRRHRDDSSERERYHRNEHDDDRRHDRDHRRDGYDRSRRRDEYSHSRDSLRHSRSRY